MSLYEPSTNNSFPPETGPENAPIPPTEQLAYSETPETTLPYAGTLIPQETNRSWVRKAALIGGPVLATALAGGIFVSAKGGKESDVNKPVPQSPFVSAEASPSPTETTEAYTPVQVVNEFGPDKPTVTQDIVKDLYANIATAVNSNDMDFLAYSGINPHSAAGLTYQGLADEWQPFMKTGNDVGSFTYRFGENNIQIQPYPGQKTKVHVKVQFAMLTDYVVGIGGEVFQSQEFDVDHGERLLPNGQTLDIWEIVRSDMTQTITREQWLAGL